MAEQKKPIIGFIGFGEVASTLSRRMKEMGGKVLAFDKFPDQASKRAAPLQIPVLATLEDLVAGSDLLLSCLWPDAAVEAAKETAPFLSRDKVYCDMNSISPETTAEIEEAVSLTGAGFVKIATMAAIPDRGYKVPLLAGGTRAGEVAEILSGLGLTITSMGPDPRQPAAMKILRSVCLKGLVALGYEMLRGAEEYGITDQILESASETMSKMSFRDTLNNWISSTAIHARRRAKEMEEAIQTLNHLGIKPTMSVATKEVFEEIAGAGLDQAFEGRIPDSFQKVIDGVKKFESTR